MAGTTDVVIETPRGCREKFAYEPEHGAFVLRHVLPLGMVFPYDFGFVPDTRADDGDPIDVIVVSDLNTYPGVRMACRLIGALCGTQRGEGSRRIRNDRLIAIPEAQETLANVRTLTDLPSGLVDQLEQFFVTYTGLEGKDWRHTRRVNAVQARRLLASASTG
jgi:inorganic pyrophosphatase